MLIEHTSSNAMRTVVIKAIEAVQSIRSGMDDASLMEKFNISLKGLHILFNQLVASGLLQCSELEERMSLACGTVVIDPYRAKWPDPQIEKLLINAEEALNCIRSGMPDTALMRKYRLSTKGLQSLFTKLLTARLISQSELDERVSGRQTGLLLDEQAGEHFAVDSSRPSAVSTQILDVIRTGTSRDALREKYNISDAQLDAFLDDLVCKNLITRKELDLRLPVSISEFSIRDRYSNRVIFSDAATSFAALVQKAAASGIDLGNCDLGGCYLPGIDLSGARLCGAKLEGANLVGVDFTGAQLNGADLVSANLHGTILFKTNLAKANLSECNMNTVYGVWAFLAEANLSEANLTNANLAGANLSGANLFQTILTGTNLTGAYLKGVNLELATMGKVPF